MKRVCSPAALSLLLVITAFSGCGKTNGAGTEFDSEGMIGAYCSVATDQRKSFMAKVPGFPLQLTVDANFTPDQRQAISMAANQWNVLGRQLIGEDFFQVSVTRISDSVRTTDPTNCSNNFGSGTTLSILGETSATRWLKLGFGENIPGATLRCFAGGEVREQMVMIYTNINNGRGIDPRQFSSVVIHELGHVIGLDHSCDDKVASAKYLACAGLSETHPYHAAVMFPSLRVSATTSDSVEIKDRLRSNDTMRAECLYRTAP